MPTAPLETKITSTPSLTSSPICSAMAPTRVKDGRPSAFATTNVPALMHTRLARRKAAREGTSWEALGVVVLIPTLGTQESRMIHPILRHSEAHTADPT